MPDPERQPRSPSEPASDLRVRVVCTVRGCEQELERCPRTWRCARGHAFDVGRGGHVNLLQPQDSRSRAPGDSRAAVLGREKLEERGLAEALHAALERHVVSLALPSGAALDVGAGTGRLLQRLVLSCGLEGWDLSSAAVERGSRRHPALSWVIANADRRLPFAAGSFDLVLSCAGPRNPREFRRVLSARGALLVVVPAPDDLIELRAAALGEGRVVDRSGPALAALAPHFELRERFEARAQLTLERGALEDLLCATYRGARHAERERLADLEQLEVTLASEVLHLVLGPGARG
jgi:23S rRNA (guanine745-N1)-methyltransferase